jgi:DNA repair exonuclease SbcCD nuclease subunit
VAAELRSINCWKAEVIDMAKTNKASKSTKLSDYYVGLLAIGDPHVEGRQPGFRKDDYPNVVLEKIRWCLGYAKENRLLPMFLGDLFDKPRDNPTWMMGRLIEIMSKVPSVGIYGNHDCAETQLNENDSLSILIKAGCFRLVSAEKPWRGIMNGRQVYVGGSSYREKVPFEFSLRSAPKRKLFENNPFVVWLTHHDISFAGYDNGRIDPHEIENVELLINGHIHRKLEEVQAGETRWITPGNISRRSRSDACKQHTPKVTRIDVDSESYRMSEVEVPHQAYDEVFHEAVAAEERELTTSEFVSGLAELTSRRTESGAGLHKFLADNLGSFNTEIADEIRKLATEVTGTEELIDA